MVQSEGPSTGPSVVPVVGQAQLWQWTCEWENETRKSSASLGPGPAPGLCEDKCRPETLEAGLLPSGTELGHLVTDDTLGTRG